MKSTLAEVRGYMTPVDRVRLEKMFSSKKSRSPENWGFVSPDQFVNWWEQALVSQKHSCAYCETDIAVINRVIDAELIGQRRVRGSGFRGRNLELERKRPSGRYEPENCVLVCAYCNNDKSNVHADAEIYKEFFGEARHRHFKWLASKLDLIEKDRQAANE